MAGQLRPAPGLAASLTRVLQRGGIPILGVSIGRYADRQTWRIDFAPEATAAQRATAQTILEGFDPDAPFTAAELAAAREQEALDAIDAKSVQAVLHWCADKFAITATQAREEVLAHYRRLP